MVSDGNIGPQYDGIVQGSVVMSEDGKRLSYVAVKGKSDVAVIDGEEGREFDGLIEGSHPIFSPDGRHVAYGVYKGNFVFVVADGKFGPSYQGVNVVPTFTSTNCLEYLADKSESGKLGLYHVTHRFR